MSDLQTLMDEYDSILEDEFLAAVEETQADMEQFLEENYPTDTDELPESNNIDQIAVERLETQLSGGFQANLSTLSDLTFQNTLAFLLLTNYGAYFTNSTLKSSINFELKEIIKTSKSNTNFTSKKSLLDSIGLTENQNNNLQKYRNTLTRISNLDNPETISWKSLRQLSASQRSQARRLSETGIKPHEIERLVLKHKTAMLQNRAKAIGNHLSSKIPHMAQQFVIANAIALSLIKPDEYKRDWITAGDERVRQSHKGILSVSLEQPFITPLGNFMYPPLEINCRCHVEIRKTNEQ